MNDEIIRKMLEKAKEGMKNSYSPYSKFSVGASVLTDDNTIYNGCNIENASYGLSNCAERTAIFKAVSEGYKHFKAIAIISNSNEIIRPCGACRQVIREFMDENGLIICASNDINKYDIKKVGEILPYSFDKTYL